MAVARILEQLRWLIAIAITVFIIIFIALSWQSYARTLEQKRHELLEESRIVQEFASKVIQTNEVLLDRAADLFSVAGLEPTPGAEKDLYPRLHRLIADFPQVRALSVFNADGRVVASTISFPVPHVTIADRAFFINHKLHGVRSSINPTLDGRLAQGRIFTFTRRLDGPKGEFRGMVALALSPDYFSRFYRDFEGNSEDAKGWAHVLFTSAGEVIARYPEPQDSGSYYKNVPVMKSIGEGAINGIVEGASGPDDGFRFTAFRRVAPYPFYIATSRTPDSVLAEWRSDVLSFAIVVIVASIALVLAIWVAMRRARSEGDAIRHWHEEAARRTQVETQLRQLQKYEALGELTGGLAHDFNNLLQIIGNGTECMSHLRSNEDIGRFLSPIRGAVASGSALTKHLLAFARKQQLTFVRIRTCDAVPAICELVRLSLPRSIKLVCEGDSSIHDFVADRAELELALINVIVNARDAMPDGGSITVRGCNVPARAVHAAGQHDAKGDFIAISISDTGSGIPEAILPRIFEPFFTTKKEKGTGLGLSRVYGYVKQLGGHVTAENAAGGGAVITLYFPAAEPIPGDLSPPLTASGLAFDS